MFVSEYVRMYNLIERRVRILGSLLEIKRNDTDFSRYCLLALVKLYDRVLLNIPPRPLFPYIHVPNTGSKQAKSVNIFNDTFLF